MVRHHLKKHRTKVALGIPMVFLLASSLSLVRDADDMCIVPDDKTFVEVDEKITLNLTAKADEPINVIGATLHIPSDYFSIEQISRDKSIIDLWTEEPTADDSKITFSGGIVSDEGFTGEGIVLKIVIVPKKEGEVEVSFEDGKMLAHDGTGIEVTCERNPISFTIRALDSPSPDVNGDESVNLYDFGIVSARLFMEYERPYDLNLDGKISIADIGILLMNLGK